MTRYTSAASIHGVEVGRKYSRGVNQHPIKTRQHRQALIWLVFMDNVNECACHSRLFGISEVVPMGIYLQLILPTLQNPQGNAKYMQYCKWRAYMMAKRRQMLDIKTHPAKEMSLCAAAISAIVFIITFLPFCVLFFFMSSSLPTRGPAARFSPLWPACLRRSSSFHAEHSVDLFVFSAACFCVWPPSLTSSC